MAQPERKHHANIHNAAKHAATGTRRALQRTYSRYGIKVHVYALHLPAKSAAMVEDANVPAEDQGTPLLDGARFVFSSGNGEKTYTFYNTSMDVLANFLSTFSQYSVVDKTGLQGRYKFVLRRFTDAPAGQDPAPSIDMPVPFDLRSLGMKVEIEKVNSTVWAVDRMEKPTPN